MLAQSCSLHAVTLSAQSRRKRHIMAPIGASESTDKVTNFHPYCPVLGMNNGPSAVLECTGVLELLIPRARSRLPAKAGGNSGFNLSLKLCPSLGEAKSSFMRV